MTAMRTFSIHMDVAGFYSDWFISNLYIWGSRQPSILCSYSCSLDSESDHNRNWEKSARLAVYLKIMRTLTNDLINIR